MRMITIAATTTAAATTTTTTTKVTISSKVFSFIKHGALCVREADADSPRRAEGRRTPLPLVMLPLPGEKAAKGVASGCILELSPGFPRFVVRH